MYWSGLEPSRWGNGGQPQPILGAGLIAASLADGGMGANRNEVLVLTVPAPA